MIATLSGTVREKRPDLIVVEVNGVGYGLLVPSEDYHGLQIEQSAKLYVSEHIREQSYDLYGFLRRESQQLFEKLLEVNGIGPKMAINMLSIGSERSLKQAIASGDTAYIAQANGVGKRVAERVVVELKDKVGLIGVDLSETDLLQAVDQLPKDEAAEALIALGYSPADAAVALKDIDRDITTAERVKQALQGAHL